MAELDAGPELDETGAPSVVERGYRSDRRYAGDPRQIEFQADPDAARIEGAARALQEIAAAAKAVGAPNGDLIRVCLTLVRLTPGLPLNLFGFHFVGVRPDGALVDALGDGQEIKYALIVNQPVAVLRETALRFLQYLVARQAPIQQVVAGKRRLTELSRLVARTDATQADLAWDLPPESAQAMNVIAATAAEIGIRVEVRFQLDPFPSQGQVASRVLALRRLYNEEEVVREAIDRMVSALGARDASIRGGPENVRAFMRRNATIQGWWQYINQATRDAQVCGNGYLVTTMSGLEGQMRCLRPDRVVITDDGHYVEPGGAGLLAPDRVSHLRGIYQVQSPYGISVLEPLLYLKARHDFVRELEAMTNAVNTSGLTDEQREILDTNIRLVRSLAAEAEKRVGQLLVFFSTGLPPSSPDLYFPGQQRLS